jgi:peptidoglycan-associated lipoprotein
MFMRHTARVAAVAGILGLTLGLAGCGGYVKKSEFNNEVAKLREEAQTGDRQVSGRVDSTNQAVAEHQRRLDALEQQLQALQREYQVSIEKLKGQIRFNVPVHFDFDRSDLRESDRPVLDRFASVAKEYYPGALITVEGFADPAGGQAYNLRLGERRAEAVRDYLTGTGGLPADELKVVSYGKARNRQVVPGAKGPGDKGLENRRVALVIDQAAVSGEGVATP